MLNYNSFKEKITKKHYLFNDINHHIEQCKNAKIAVANTIKINPIILWIILMPVIPNLREIFFATFNKK